MSSEFSLLLAGPVMAVGLLTYRADYRRHGRTTGLGVVLLLVAWRMPHLVLGYAIPMFQVPHSARQWTGYALMALGACGCAVPVACFSARMIVGRERRGVAIAGPYRWSRNPQYVTDSGVPIGYARTGVAVMAWVGVALDLVLVHLTVLIEEEHLERQVGPEYRAYTTTVPRYVRLRPLPGR